MENSLPGSQIIDELCQSLDPHCCYSFNIIAVELPNLFTEEYLRHATLAAVVSGCNASMCSASYCRVAPSHRYPHPSLIPRVEPDDQTLLDFWSMGMRPRVPMRLWRQVNTNLTSQSCTA